MTGFCSISEQIVISNTPVVITIDLKTLNGRFFEVVAKLPPKLNRLELAFSSALQEILLRGRVFLNIRFEIQEASLESVTPSWAIIDQYMAAITAIAEKYNTPRDVTLVDLISLPNALVSREQQLSTDDEQRILDLVTKAAHTVMAARSDEGKRLQKDFDNLFETCSKKITYINDAFVLVMDKQKDLVKQALANQELTPEQTKEQLDELQAVMRKIDIHEEITRFKSHLEAVRSVFLSETKEKGKRLDFVIQELFRETNTIMAKCPGYDISASAIDIKVELEKAREQIQNII